MTMKVDIDNISREEWEQLARNFSDYSIYQTWPYQQNRAQMNHQDLKRIVVINDKGRIETMGQMRIQNIKPLGLRIGYIQRGPLMCDSNSDNYCSSAALKILRETLLGESVNVLRVVPNICRDEFGHHFAKALHSAGFMPVTYIRPYRTFLLAVNDTEEDMRKRLRKSFRRDLKNAEKIGIEVREGKSEEFCDILTYLHSELLSRKKFKGVNPQEFIKIQTILSSEEKMNFVAAYYEGEPVAALLGTNLGDTSVVLLAASNERGLKCGSSYLIWWRGAVAALRAGMQQYDLGGIDPKNNPSVYQFKSRMGGVDMFHIGAYESTSNALVKYTWHIAEKIYRLII